MVVRAAKKNTKQNKTSPVKPSKKVEDSISETPIDIATEQKKAIQLAIVDELAYIPTDCYYFISNYGWVQDPDNVADGGKSRFYMWPEQVRALKEIQDHRLNIILKARQLGMTWLALWFALHGMLSQAGYTVVALSKRDEDAKELANRMDFMLRQLPRWLVQERIKDNKGFMFTYETTAHEITIYRADGSEASRFITMTAAKDSGRSFTAALVLLDEWAFQQWAQEIWTSAYPTINRPTGGKVIGLSTAKRVTLFQRIWERFADFGFHRIFLAWWADPRRSQDWYAAAKKALSSGEKYKQEYPATPEEAFSAGEGTSFPEFSLDVHVCDPFEIPAHWRRWMSVDNGYADPFSWLWYAVSEDGIVYVYREFGRSESDPKLLHKEQAMKVVELMSHANVDTQDLEQEHVDFCVAGLDAWSTHHRDQTGKDLIDYYNDGGLSHVGFIRATTDRKLRKATVHHYLAPFETDVPGTFTAKLQIFNTCTHLIECLPDLTNDEADREKVADIHDHEYDSLSYGLIAYHTGKSKPIKDDQSNIQKHKQRLAKAYKHRRGK